MLTRKIEGYFPELGLIEDEGLRKQVINVWADAMEEGGWDDISHLPYIAEASYLGQINVYPSLRYVSQHIRFVAKGSYQIGQLARDLYKYDVNLDYLVAGALLHDVGMILVFEPDGKDFKVRNKNAIVRHPVLSAYLVMKGGLPAEVVHIVASHSAEGEHVNRSPEASIVHHVDFAIFNAMLAIEEPDRPRYRAFYYVPASGK